jgi:hypothetical protein
MSPRLLADAASDRKHERSSQTSRSIAPSEELMEDWQARLDDLEPRLVEWNRAFERELEQVCKERKLIGWFKKPAQVELDAAAIEARRRAGIVILAELTAFCDALCDHYPTALPQERCKIRAEVGSHEALFDEWWGYVEASPPRIKNPADARALVRAFIAVAIDDMRADIHALNDVMRRVLVAAVSADLDWRTPLAAAAKVANRSTGGGSAQLREYFETFELSKYFKDHVAKELREAERRAAQLREMSSGR